MGRSKKYDEKLLLEIVEAYYLDFECEIRESDLIRYAATVHKVEIGRKVFKRYNSVASRIDELNAIYRKKYADRAVWEAEQYKTTDVIEFLRKNNSPSKLMAAIKYLDEKDLLKTRKINELLAEIKKLSSITMNEETKEKLAEAKRLKEENIFLRQWIDCNINATSAMELLKNRSFPVKRDLDNRVPEADAVEETVIGYEDIRKPYDLSSDAMIESALSLMDVDEEEFCEDMFDDEIEDLGTKLMRELNET